MKTNEGANQFEHSLDHWVEFFSKAGSIFDTSSKNTFYNNEEDILSLFQRSWIVEKEITFKLLMWLRDCRGGAGNRSGYRKCLKWLANNDSDYILANMDLLINSGRWDDLRTLFGTECEPYAVIKWLNAILSNNVLAAKWAKRTDIPLYLTLKKNHKVKNMGDFRRLLANVRKNDIIEYKMCSNNWKEIDYSKVPSVAMARYTNAFKTHDEERFEKYKNSLNKGEVKINASVLFPHNCTRTAHNGDKDIANAQFDALPNYIKTDENVMVICDSSGSMDSVIGGNTTAYDVSTSLALYCSSKLPKNNPFYKKFIQFCSESVFSDWGDMEFSDAIDDNNGLFNGAVGSTRIDKALDFILFTGKTFKVEDKNMPSILLICSDMQFYNGTSMDWVLDIYDNVETEIERSLKKWEDVGYSRPKIVYWDLVPYSGQPDTINSKDIALISGFSPSILKSVLACEDFSPKAIMMKTLEKYEIIVPK